jgi:hypothetical protein
MTDINQHMPLPRKGTEANGPSKTVYPTNIMTFKKVDVGQARMCLLARDAAAFANPTELQIRDCIAELTEIQRGIQKIGDKLVRHQILVNCQEKKMLCKDDQKIVNSFTDIRDSFRESPSIYKCHLVFEATVTWPHLNKTRKNNEWVKAMEETIMDELQLEYAHIPEGKERGFVANILEESCLKKARDSFGKLEDRVGITMRKNRDHPLGAAPVNWDSHTFCNQNITNWNLLVKIDKEAAKIAEERWGKDVPSVVFEEPIYYGHAKKVALGKNPNKFLEAEDDEDDDDGGSLIISKESIAPMRTLVSTDKTEEISTLRNSLSLHEVSKMLGIKTGCCPPQFLVPPLRVH